MPEPTQQPALSIVLPAYNEEARIEPALDELFDWLEGAAGGLATHGACEVLVVDDGSTDRTVSVIERRSEARSDEPAVPPRLRVVKRAHAGKGAAVTAGMLAAEGRMVIFADADMATPPSQIPLLMQALEDHEVALGSRIQPDGSDRRASQPLYRRLLGRIYRRIAGFWVTGDIPDTQCGFKGFQRQAAQDIFSRMRTGGMAFDAEVIYLAGRLGYDIAIVPVVWQDVRGSRMRIRPGPAASVMWDLFRIPLIHRSIRPDG